MKCWGSFEVWSTKDTGEIASMERMDTLNLYFIYAGFGNLENLSRQQWKTFKIQVRLVFEFFMSIFFLFTLLLDVKILALKQLQDVPGKNVPKGASMYIYCRSSILFSRNFGMSFLTGFGRNFSWTVCYLLWYKISGNFYREGVTSLIEKKLIENWNCDVEYLRD